MKYSDIKYYIPVNDTDTTTVAILAKSILKNGWQGCPILTWGENLVTGSHRLEALKSLENDGYDIDSLGEIAEDVTDLIDDVLATFEMENGYMPDIDYQDIGWIFEGTWVETYKKQIAEW